MNAKALWGRAVRIGAPVAAALALALAMAFWLHAGAPVMASAVAAEAPMAHHGHGVEHGAHAMANGAAALLKRRSGSGGHAGQEQDRREAPLLEVAESGGESSNSVFEILEDWERQLQQLEPASAQKAGNEIEEAQ